MHILWLGLGGQAGPPSDPVCPKPCWPGLFSPFAHRARLESPGQHLSLTFQRRKLRTGAASSHTQVSGRARTRDSWLLPGLPWGRVLPTAVSRGHSPSCDARTDAWADLSKGLLLTPSLFFPAQCGTQGTSGWDLPREGLCLSLSFCTDLGSCNHHEDRWEGPPRRVLLTARAGSEHLVMEVCKQRMGTGHWRVVPY